MTELSEAGSANTGFGPNGRENKRRVAITEINPDIFLGKKKISSDRAASEALLTLHSL